MRKKPGVMIYFDLRRMLKLLPDAEKGQLFEAILQYGEEGSIPQLTQTLQVVWPLIQLRLDSDANRYNQTVIKKKYAIYTRWAKERGQQVQSFPQWLEDNGYDLEDYMEHIPVP